VAPRAARVFLVFTAWCPSAVARQRRSDRCCWCGFLPAPIQTARPPFFWDTHATGSPSCPGCDGGGSSGSGHGREGRQGLLVAAPLRVTVFPRCRRHHLRCLGLLLAPFRDSITSDGGTAKGGHGRAELRGEAQGGGRNGSAPSNMSALSI
jgi:hypothetical protein